MHAAVVAIYQDNENFSHIKSYVKELKHRGLKTVDLYIFFPSKKQLESYHPAKHEYPFRSGDFNWIGKYKGDALKQSVAKNYDVLIDLSRGGEFACDVFIAKSKATWKVGEFDNNRVFLLDFMIDVKQESDIRNLTHHINEYLLNFNKSNAA